MKPKEFFAQYAVTDTDLEDLEKSTISCPVCGKDIGDMDDGYKMLALLNNKVDKMDLIYGINVLFFCEGHTKAEVEKAHIIETALILLKYMGGLAGANLTQQGEQKLLDSINDFNN